MIYWDHRFVIFPFFSFVPIPLSIEVVVLWICGYPSFVEVIVVEFGLVPYPSCVEVIVVLALCLASV